MIEFERWQGGWIGSEGKAKKPRIIIFRLRSGIA